MSPRHGATLVEVLVAIFVMGIGMIALLTLFPLGALRMAQAIQDDRCAAAVRNADTIATLKNMRNDPGVRTPPWLINQNLPNVDIFKDIPGAGTGRTLPADPEGPSYPVYVDPVGYLNLPQGAQQRWVATGTGGNYRGGVTEGLISRSPPRFIGGAFAATNTYKWFTLLDDYQFDSNEPRGGTVFNFNPAQGPTDPKVIRRDIRYSWAYMVQRPRSSDPSIAACTVVVYNKRPLGLSATLAIGESAYRAIFNLTSNTITVDWTGAANQPSLRPGDWLLDCTFVPTTKNGVQYGTAHAFFYRIIGVTFTSAKTADVEVQQPIRGFPLPLPTPVIQGTTGGVMVLEGIADVYERGLDKKFD